MTNKERQDLCKLFDIVFPNQTKSEYITVQRFSNGKPDMLREYQTTRDIIQFMNANQNKDLFYSVATTNGCGFRNEKCLKSASAIVLDFDYKDEKGNYIEKPNVITFTKELKKKLDLFFSAVICSGHGYQIVIAIEKTYDIDRWNDITKKLGDVYGADSMALLKTQIMRLPGSVNHKTKPYVPCSVVYCQCYATIKRYSLEVLEKKIEAYNYKTGKQKYKPDVKPCVSRMLNGVPKGERNVCMGRIISFFRYSGYKKKDIWEIVNIFNNKCSPPKDEKELKGEFNFYWKNDYNLNGCYISDELIGNAQRHRTILNKYCVPGCGWQSRITYNFDNNTTNRPKVRIPLKAFKSNLNGTDMAILMLINKEQAVKKGDIYKKVFISEQTTRKSINKLYVNKLIKVSGNSVYSIDKGSESVDIDYKATELLINKKITDSNAKTYFYISYFNNVLNKRPTIKQLAELMDADRKNVAKSIKQLEESGLINKAVVEGTQGYYYQLSIA